MNSDERRKRELAIDEAIRDFMTKLSGLKTNYAEIVGILDIIKHKTHQGQQSASSVAAAKRYMG